MKRKITYYMVAALLSVITHDTGYFNALDDDNPHSRHKKHPHATPHVRDRRKTPRKPH